MALAYLFSLVVGLGVLLVQLVAAHGGGDDASADHDVAGAHDPHLAKPSAGSDFGILSLVFSIRFWVFALFAFGLSGTLLDAFHLAGGTAVFLVALAAGLLAGAVAVMFLRALAKSAGPGAPHERAAVGKLGRVIVACGKGRVGQVRVTIEGKSVDLVATTDEGEIPRGAAIIVDDVTEGGARVSRAPAEAG